MYEIKNDCESSILYKKDKQNANAPPPPKKKRIMKT